MQNERQEPTGVAPGTKPTDAEFEERLRIVETLIVLGQAQTVEQCIYGLGKAGRPNLAVSTVHKYIKIAKQRLAEADSETKAARREMMLRRISQAEMEISNALRKHDVKPSWHDLISVLRLMKETVGHSEEFPPDPEPDEQAVINAQTEVALSTMLEEMLDRSRDVIEAELGADQDPR